MDGEIYLGMATHPISLPLPCACQHGLILGARGTGKRETTRVLIEGFSTAGIPVVCVDAFGDLSGLAAPGVLSEKILRQQERSGLKARELSSFPCTFWDFFGREGLPLRTSVHGLGASLLGKLFDLENHQLTRLAAAMAPDAGDGEPLLDFQDLRESLERARRARSRDEGGLGPVVTGAIQRRILTLEMLGVNALLGEPAFAVRDFLPSSASGIGAIHVIQAERLRRSPALYVTLVNWLLRQLLEEFTESGVHTRPRLGLVLTDFFAALHAHPAGLDDFASAALELSAKGIALFIESDTKSALTTEVKMTFGNRIQHGVSDDVASDPVLKEAALRPFRCNVNLDLEETIRALEREEALISVLTVDGVPSIVQRVGLRPPASRMGSLSPAELRRMIAKSPSRSRYDDRYSRDDAKRQLTARWREQHAGRKKRVA